MPKLTLRVWAVDTSAGQVFPAANPDRKAELVQWEANHLTHPRAALSNPIWKGGSMKIGIIGAGNIGGTLTRRLAKLGHQIFVANSRGPETLKGLATETGAKAVSVSEAARSGELVVVTI